MSSTDKSFTIDELAILRDVCGRTLESIDAVIVARSDLSWNTVRLHLDGLDVDINNHLGEIEVDELGSLEEFGLMSVNHASGATVEIPEVSAATTTMEIGKVIIGVRVISNVIVVHGDGAPVATITYPQAIILEHTDGVIVLDKECWFSEMLAVKQGENAGALVYDESINWEDNPEEDPTTHYEFSAVEQVL
jgi:hypothetical protein